jgi:hypothetical protein
MAKDHGPSVKDEKQYEGLRKKGTGGGPQGRQEERLAGHSCRPLAAPVRAARARGVPPSAAKPATWSTSGSLTGSCYNGISWVQGYVTETRSRATSWRTSSFRRPTTSTANARPTPVAAGRCSPSGATTRQRGKRSL